MIEIIKNYFSFDFFYNFQSLSVQAMDRAQSLQRSHSNGNWCQIRSKCPVVGIDEYGQNIETLRHRISERHLKCFLKRIFKVINSHMAYILRQPLAIESVNS